MDWHWFFSGSADACDGCNSRMGRARRTVCDDGCLVRGLQCISALAVNGMISFKFSRPLKSSDDRDLSLEKCLHFIYPVVSGPVDSAKRNIWKHAASPIVSKEKICLGQCIAANRAKEAAAAAGGGVNNGSIMGPNGSNNNNGAVGDGADGGSATRIPTESVNSGANGLSTIRKTKYGTPCIGGWIHG